MNVLLHLILLMRFNRTSTQVLQGAQAGNAHLALAVLLAV